MWSTVNHTGYHSKQHVREETYTAKPAVRILYISLVCNAPQLSTATQAIELSVTVACVAVDNYGALHTNEIYNILLQV